MKSPAISSFVVCPAFFTGLARAEQPSGIPAEVLDEFKYFLGSWKAKGIVDGKPSSGWYKCRMAVSEDGAPCGLRGRFYYKDGDEVHSGENLIGWDSEKQCILDVGFNASGGFGTIEWTRTSPKRMEGKTTSVRDGKKTTGELVLVKKSPTELVIVSAGGDQKLRRVFTKVNDAPSS